jgi:allophanate hydrolase subunit 2
MNLSNSTDFGVIRAVTATGVGAPLAIMSDRLNTGGYPTVASLIDVDHRAFAKLRPGDALILERLSMGKAGVDHARPREVEQASKPRTAAQLSSEFLLSVNSISGVWGGDDF